MKIRTIDLFAGIGGMRLGVELAAKKLGIDFENVFSSEIDKFSIQTYQANFPEKDIYGDITQIKDSEIKELIPDHNILLAGFPCQPFSQAGLRQGFEDIRGTLFFDIMRVLKIKKPDAFILENVKHFKGHDKGRTLKVVLENLRKYYYVPEPQILNARDFGVPQNRQRIFIVGFKNPFIENFLYPTPLNKKKPLKVGNILEKEDFIDNKYVISTRLWEGHKRRKREHKIKGNGFGYGLFNDVSLYTNTISARYYKDGSEALISRGSKNPRKLTPRECARLQGFPEYFKLPVSDAQLYKQFGNSVAVPVVKNLSLKIIKKLYNL
jgi:DNA (cytosine-5)-methyltransferase 1